MRLIVYFFQFSVDDAIEFIHENTDLGEFVQNVIKHPTTFGVALIIHELIQQLDVT